MAKNSCIVLVEKLKRFFEDNPWKDKKILKNSFISTFTFTFTTTIIIMQIFNNGNILTNGRNERDYIRRERLGYIYYWKVNHEKKPIGRHIGKNETLLAREENDRALETTAFILEVVFLLEH